MSQPEPDLSLADSLPNLVFTCRADGRIDYANRAWGEYTGAPGAIDWLPFVHSEDKPGALDTWKDALGRGEAADLDVRLRRADGAYLWHVLKLVPLSQAGRWLASATDIDERRRLERSQWFFSETGKILSESLNYKQTLRKLPALFVPTWADICGVFVVDEDNGISPLEVACSDGIDCEAIHQLHVERWRLFADSPESVAQAMKRGAYVFVPRVTSEILEGVAPGPQAAIAQRLGATSAMVVPMRSRHRTLGALALVSLQSNRVYTPEDLAVARALARRAGIAIENGRLHASSRQIARDLRAASRSRDRFLDMMSHEMRTPITTIYGNAQVLRRLLPSLDREAVESSLGDIKSDAERLHLIIENLLALAHSTDHRRNEVEPVLVSRFLERQRDLHLRSKPERPITIDVQDPDCCVVANYAALELVLRNLLSNAEKYSPQDGLIELTARRHGDEVEIRVLDSGDGVPAADITHVFQPFFRSDSTRAQVSGVGIGLTVCKYLVEARGGRIWALPGERGGLELGFSLPAERELADV